MRSETKVLLNVIRHRVSFPELEANNDIIITHFAYKKGFYSGRCFDDILGYLFVKSGISNTISFEK